MVKEKRSSPNQQEEGKFDDSLPCAQREKKRVARSPLVNEFGKRDRLESMKVPLHQENLIDSFHQIPPMKSPSCQSS